jgi:hypothetical protein
VGKALPVEAVPVLLLRATGADGRVWAPKKKVTVPVGFVDPWPVTVAV